MVQREIEHVGRRANVHAVLLSDLKVIPEALSMAEQLFGTSLILLTNGIDYVNPKQSCRDCVCHFD